MTRHTKIGAHRSVASYQLRSFADTQLAKNRIENLLHIYDANYFADRSQRLIEINGNDKFLLPEILDVSEMGTAAIRQRVTSPVGASATTADAVGMAPAPRP